MTMTPRTQRALLHGSAPGQLEFPHYIDSSMRSSFVSCPQKFFYEYMRHLKSLAPSVHLVAGGAFAKGLEITRRAYYGDENTDARTAIGLGAKALIREYGDFTPDARSPKDCENLLGAFDYYFTQWPLEHDTIQPYRGPDGHLGVEFSFALPIPDTAHPVTGDPILYVGRFDMLGRTADGTLWVVDEKTTQSLGPSWSRQWDLRGQFTGYCWAARTSGYSVVGALIRGISLLKRSYGNAQAVTYRSDWLVSDWLEQLSRDVNRLRDVWESGHWDRNYGDACASYGNCTYLSLCDTPDPEAWVEGNFERRVWNPLTHQEEVA